MALGRRRSTITPPTGDKNEVSAAHSHANTSSSEAFDEIDEVYADKSIGEAERKNRVEAILLKRI